MIKILSWNFQNITNSFKVGALREVVDENDIDILVLQEAAGSNIPRILENTHKEVKYLENKKSNQVRVFFKESEFNYYSGYLGPQNKYALVTFHRAKDKYEFNILGVHFYSKLDRTERVQMWKNHEMITDIIRWEDDTSNRHSILIGDLNCNPFENNLSDPYHIQIYNNKDFVNHKLQFDTNIWYNPTWNLLGDHDPYNSATRVNGTYFRNVKDELPIWNLIDGFLIRPDIMHSVNYKDTRIIEGTTNYYFLKSRRLGEYDSFIESIFSDHLPIVLTLNI